MWHVLALALGGRTIAEWKRVMTQPEFLDWMTFHRLFPFDDFNRFHRPAAMVASSLGGGDIQARLDWLQPEPVLPGLNEADMSILRAFGMRPPARS